MLNAPSPDAAAGEKNTAVNSRGDHCVPLPALTIDGTPPTVGDEVEYTAKGKVARVEGDKAYVTTTEVNGEPFTAPTEKKDPTEEEEDAEMLRLASEADDNHDKA